jgi:hypothetical protein
MRVLTWVRSDGCAGLGRHGRRRWRQRRWHMACGGGRLAGLGRKWLSGLDFDHGLHKKDAGAMGIAFRGSGWRDGGRREAHGGGARLWSFGEESREWKGGEAGESRPAMLLTAMHSSWGTCSTAESGGAVACWAAEVRRVKACAARVCEARTAAAGLGDQGRGAAAL